MLRVCAGKKEVNMRTFIITPKAPGEARHEFEADGFRVNENGDVVFYEEPLHEYFADADVNTLAVGRGEWISIVEVNPETEEEQNGKV